MPHIREDADLEYFETMANSPDERSIKKLQAEVDKAITEICKKQAED